jgi:hypothetical protein
LRRSKSIVVKRAEFLNELAKLCSGKLSQVEDAPRRSTPSTAVLSEAGLDLSDPFGWTAALKDKRAKNPRNTQSRGLVGDAAVAYLRSRDARTQWLLQSFDDLFSDYFNRVEAIEGFVYMECVGIQLEKHYSLQRANALTAFEKKTELTTAMNVAARKRLDELVMTEIQAKLDRIGPDVSHSQVKETKEIHLESKNLKAELHELAVRRLTRARECSTERVVTLMSIWAREEDGGALSELKALGEAITTLECAFSDVAVEALVYCVAQVSKSDSSASI